MKLIYSYLFLLLTIRNYSEVTVFISDEYDRQTLSSISPGIISIAENEDLFFQNIKRTFGPIFNLGGSMLHLGKKCMYKKEINQFINAILQHRTIILKNNQDGHFQKLSLQSLNKTKITKEDIFTFVFFKHIEKEKISLEAYIFEKSKNDIIYKYEDHPKNFFKIFYQN
jgi:hypothetical protein